MLRLESQELDITVDCYPYTARSTSIGSAVFDLDWKLKETREGL